MSMLLIQDGLNNCRHIHDNLFFQIFVSMFWSTFCSNREQWQTINDFSSTFDKLKNMLISHFQSVLVARV